MIWRCSECGESFQRVCTQVMRTEMVQELEDRVETRKVLGGLFAFCFKMREITVCLYTDGIVL